MFYEKISSSYYDNISYYNLIKYIPMKNNLKSVELLRKLSGSYYRFSLIKFYICL